MNLEFNNKMNYLTRVTNMINAYKAYGKNPTQIIVSPDVLQYLLVDIAKEEEDIMFKEADQVCVTILGCLLKVTCNEDYTRGTVHVK